jgi:hypothetical protein
MIEEILEKYKVVADVDYEVIAEAIRKENSEYVRNEAIQFAEFIRHYFNDSHVDSWTRNADGKIFFDIEDVLQEFIQFNNP